MSNKIKGFWVALTDDVSAEDAEYLMGAFRLYSFVAGVTAEPVVPADYLNRRQVTASIRRGLMEALGDE